MSPHPLEIRAVAGFSRRVHAGAFARAVETVMDFDSVDAGEAVRRVMAEIEAGTLRLNVAGGFAAYQYERVER